jgi:transcriptional regulator with XRE-family HTH domain
MFGPVLREARLAAEMTQEQLAFRAGLDRSYISQLENDHKSPTLDVIFLLCDAMSVSASKLIAKVEGRRRPRSSR